MTRITTTLCALTFALVCACGSEDDPSCTPPPQTIDVDGIGVLENSGYCSENEETDMAFCIWSTDPDGSAPLGTVVCSTIGTRVGCEDTWFFEATDCAPKSEDD